MLLTDTYNLYIGIVWQVNVNKYDYYYKYYWLIDWLNFKNYVVRFFPTVKLYLYGVFGGMIAELLIIEVYSFIDYWYYDYIDIDYY